MIYDISQPISSVTAVWPGDKHFAHAWTMRISRGDSCNVSCLHLSAHTGTHADAPFHYLENGSTVDQLDLHRYLGRARVATIHADRAIQTEHLEAMDWRGVERILFRTAAQPPLERFNENFIFIDEEAAAWIAAQKILLVGTDAPSVDAFSSKTLPSHKILFSQRVAILEGLWLADVPEGDYELIALPLRLVGLDASPVRAILRTLDHA